MALIRHKYRICFFFTLTTIPYHTVTYIKFKLFELGRIKKIRSIFLLNISFILPSFSVWNLILEFVQHFCAIEKERERNRTREKSKILFMDRQFDVVANWTYFSWGEEMCISLIFMAFQANRFEKHAIHFTLFRKTCYYYRSKRLNEE